MAEERMPTVSVVIGAYNAEPWIAETIESVRGQTFRDVELIVVDDGSTDQTAAVARRAAPDARIIRKENGGSASARNLGIRAAQGRYVAFLDADDLWHPRKLERQMQLFECEPALHWCCTGAVFFDTETGAVLWQAGQQYALPEGNVLEKLLVRNFMAFSTVVVRRETFDTVGRFDESSLHRISEDWDLWLRIAERWPLGVVREPLVQMRQHSEQKTETMDLEHALQSRLRIVERAAVRNPERLADVHGRAAANVCLSIGRQYLNRGARAEARRVLGYGLRRDPKALALWVFWIAAFLPPPVRRLLGRLRALYRHRFEDH